MVQISPGKEEYEPTKSIGVKSLRKKEVEMDSNDQQSLKLNCKPVTLYWGLQVYSRANPPFLQRCLSYKIQAKENQMKKSDGRLIYNYIDGDTKCLESEEREDFSCPFCFMRCGSHEGVKCHLKSSHDRYKYRFWLWNEHELQIAVSVRDDAFTNGELKHDSECRQFTFCSNRRKPSQRDGSSRTMKRIKVRFLELDLNELPRDDDTENGLTHVDDGDAIMTTPTIAHSPENTSQILQLTLPEVAHSPEKTSGGILQTTQPERVKSPEKTSGDITQPERAKSSEQPRSGVKKTYKRKVKSSSKSKITQSEISQSSSEKTSCEMLQVTQPEMAQSSEKTSCEMLKVTQSEVPESSKPKAPLDSKGKGKSAEKSVNKSPEMAQSLEKTGCNILQITQPAIAESSKPKAPLKSKGKSKSAEKSVNKSPAMAQSSGKTSCSILQITQPEIGESSEPKALLDSKGEKKAQKRTMSKRVIKKGINERQFNHSNSSQPMSLDKVMSDEDSENEAYSDSDEIEERMRLDQLKDVSTEDKRFMFLWNSFVGRQRVLADGHIPWACEEFTKLHQKELIYSITMRWQWRLFMIKLWKYGLVSGKTINHCNVFLDKKAAEAEAEEASASQALLLLMDSPVPGED